MIWTVYCFLGVFFAQGILEQRVAAATGLSSIPLHILFCAAGSVAYFCLVCVFTDSYNTNFGLPFYQRQTCLAVNGTSIAFANLTVVKQNGSKLETLKFLIRNGFVLQQRDILLKPSPQK